MDQGTRNPSLQLRPGSVPLFWTEECPWDNGLRFCIPIWHCWTQNFCDVQAVLDKLKSAALSVNKLKSKLFKTYLNDGAVFCLQLAVMLILTRLRLWNFSVPTNLKALPLFWNKPMHLSWQLKKGARFQRSQARPSASDHLVIPPVLGHPHLTAPLVVYTNDIGLI